MQIKRFEAKDMTTALRLIKDELGPEAVILSARNIKKANSILGLVKSVGVEVTAAVDVYQLPADLNSASFGGDLNGSKGHRSVNGSKKRTLRWSGGNPVKALTQYKQSHQGRDRVRLENEGVRTDVLQHLLSQEVNRDIADEIAGALTGQFQGRRLETKPEIISETASILSAKIKGARSAPGARSDSQILAVIGPTGVGKTTTVAKLAAQHAVELKKKVALVSLDAYRIGAAEQLKIYARAIAIPIKTVTTLGAFKAALNEFRKFDLILVDTPGFNPEKQTEINDLKAYLECDGSIGIHLVLSARTKESDLFHTLERLNTLAVRNLIFTKLDESRTYGNLINVLIKHPLPLSFLSNGRKVPDGIETGSLEKIVQCMFGSFRDPRATSNAENCRPSSLGEPAQLAGGCFVANKNSDVFHRPDCKWAQKIKSKNRITFSNAQTAQEKKFLPCRECQPLSGDELNAGLSLGDNVRISNYL